NDEIVGLQLTVNDFIYARDAGLLGATAATGGFIGRLSGLAGTLNTVLKPAAFAAVAYLGIKYVGAVKDAGKATDDFAASLGDQRLGLALKNLRGEFGIFVGNRFMRGFQDFSTGLVGMLGPTKQLRLGMADVTSAVQLLVKG